MKLMTAFADIHIGGRKRVNPSDIIMLIGDINYTRLILQDNSEIIVATTLKLLEKRLADCEFFRSHKSCIINLNYLVSYDENYIRMTNHLLASVSRRKGAVLREMLKGHVEDA